MTITLNLDRAMFEHIARVFALSGRNVSEAARMLGIARSTLQRLRRRMPMDLRAVESQVDQPAEAVQ